MAYEPEKLTFELEQPVREDEMVVPLHRHTGTDSPKIDIKNVIDERFPSRVRAYGTAEQGIADGVFDTIKFNADTSAYGYDSRGEWDTDVYKFVPQEEGYYQVIVGVNWTAAVQDGESFALRLLKNSTVMTQTLMVSSVNDKTHGQSLNDIIFLNADDKLIIKAWHNSTGNIRGFDHQGYNNYITINKVT